ncbi:MAG: hypothetical protein ACREXR_01680, partial [Gammaproteobacteria bacterium]
DFANRYYSRRELPTMSGAARDYFGTNLRTLMQQRKQAGAGSYIDRNLDSLFGNDPGIKSYINDQLGIDYGNDFDKLYNTLGKNYGGVPNMTL